MKKEMTDEQLEELGRQATVSLDAIHAMWLLGMKCLRLTSREYRMICRSGTRAQALKTRLYLTAENHGWSDDRLKAVFRDNGYIAFSG